LSRNNQERVGARESTDVPPELTFGKVVLDEGNTLSGNYTGSDIDG